MSSQFIFNVIAALIFAFGGLFFILNYDQAAVGLRIIFGFLSAFGFVELAYLVWSNLRKGSAGGSSTSGDHET
ncbi:hypothetical protein L5849_00005 [Erythrobacter sp. SN021]|uniref:hypothetical protein n=1 Tax=Erythrobacter sp. SN021 TaxID=2912574 RepID=UPI001F32F09C|nr:hypothetical protein [Erythrobacter sp. SN021]MCF8881076.1 hypothetical protein [Erythrobacter sp. SN021]